MATTNHERVGKALSRVDRDRLQADLDAQANQGEEEANISQLLLRCGDKPGVSRLLRQDPELAAMVREAAGQQVLADPAIDLFGIELDVVGHEMSHVRDRDILLATIVATLVGSVVLLAEFMLRWFWWGGMVGGGRRRGGGGSAEGEGFLILFVLGFVLAIVTPFFAQIIKLAMSRRREYLADAEGVLLTRYPPGLISALKKLALDTTPMRVANNATAHMWLTQPSRVPGEDHHWYEKLFSTHPPIQDRIRALEEM